MATSFQKTHAGRKLTAGMIIMFCLLYINISFAQITVTPTDITDCNKSDGKATISITTTATGLTLEYGVDGNFNTTGTFENLSAGDHKATVRDKNTQCSFDKTFTIKDAPNAITTSISGFGTTEFCNNANPPKVTLTATASGGSGDYDYSWPGGSITVSSSGRYIVNVTDKQTGCTSSLGGDVVFVPVVCSRDPNDIIGPEGYGPGKMIARSKPYSYMIRFENDPDFATAPAQVVKINHPLDQNVNPFSLRIGDFGFAGMIFTVPQNKTYYTTRLNLVDSLGIVVDVTAGIDAVKKEAFWIFESKDPATGLAPTDSHLGFLPVNDSTGKGEGYVTYLMQAGSQTKTGDTIHAQARIVFDKNEPIETPAIFNTIDAVAPTSKISALVSGTDSSTVTVSWHGQDDANGSGVRNYDLYVSENSGPFTAYQTGITDTITKFTGTKGSTYCFYTLAYDNVGNQETLKSACEASIQLGGAVLPIKWLYFTGQQVANDVLLTWATITETNTKQFVVERSLNGRQFTDIGTISAVGNSSQTNNYQFTDKDAAALRVTVVYYRLRQVARDGSSTYSIVVPIALKQNAANVIVKAYPNPFVYAITLQIMNVVSTTESDHVDLYSLDGKRLYTRKIKVMNSATVLLNDLPNLTQGVYLLRTSIDGKLYTIKMIKQ